MAAIGIDIGGTSIKGIVINRLGEILDQIKIETDAVKGKEHILDKTRTVIQTLLSRNEEINAIGIGTAGRVNADTGEIAYATSNLPGWQGTKLKETLEQEFSLPVSVDNDANVALLGEVWLGAGKGFSDVIMLTIGTGVGGANLIHGELVRGANWSGGEWGHVIFVPGGEACNCGQKGCMEQYLSGTAFVREASRVTGITYPSGVEVLEDYVRKVPAVVEMVHGFLDHLAIAVLNLHNGINPEAVIIGGGFVDSSTIWWEQFEQRLLALNPEIRVLPALLGNQAGSIGAAYLTFA